MKYVVTKHDLRCLIKELQYLIGSRVNKVYDFTTKSVCLKLSVKPDNDKKYLIIDAGSKMYTTDKFKSVRQFPTSFCSKMRKHLSNKRISSVKQINNDRVVDISIGYDDYMYHLIGELYASGNIVLTDKNYRILNVLHPHNYDEDNKVRVGYVYPFDKATEDINMESILDRFLEWNSKMITNEEIKLRERLMKSPLVVLGSSVIMSSLVELGYDPNSKTQLFTDDEVNLLVKTVHQCFVDDTRGGYVVQDGDGNYCSLEPVNYYHTKNKVKVYFPSFERACEMYFSYVDSFNKTSSDNSKKKKKDKLDPKERMIKNIDDQISNLEKKYEKKYDVSELVENSYDIFDNIINTAYNCHVNSELDDIRVMINEIENVKFVRVKPEKKMIIVNFDNVDIELDYSVNVYKNIGMLYGVGKTYKSKANRAKDKLEEAVKKTVKKRTVELVDIPGKKKEYWFEQYNWFISSDQFLVVSGKTADQNENIVKKYLDKNDVYVHSDVPGSGSCVIKNPNDVDIPISTLNQAGQFVISHTKSWNSGVGDKSWWVYANQVSKTTESGEYVGKGSFIVRGKKNYISASSLVLGMTIMFKLKDIEELRYTADETVEFAIPMCSPYISLRKFKFKVKILPGKNKKGKTIKSIIRNFNKNANLYEKSALKKIDVDEFHRVLVNGIRMD